MSGEPPAILLIEDDAAHAELIMRFLQNHPKPSRVYHVADGEAALEYLHRRGEYADPETSPHPHLVLLDLRIPKVDGLEVLRKIKADDALRHLPVVVLTTSEANGDIAQAYEYNANGYVVKPMGFDEFAQLIDDLASFWLGWNRLPGRDRS